LEWTRGGIEALVDTLCGRVHWIYCPPIIVVASVRPAGCSRTTGGRTPGLMNHGGAHSRKRFSASPDTRIITLPRVSVTYHDLQSSQVARRRSVSSGSGWWIVKS